MVVSIETAARVYISRRCMRSSSGVKEGADDGFSEIEIESGQEDRLLEEQQHQAASAQG